MNYLLCALPCAIDDEWSNTVTTTTATIWYIMIGKEGRGSASENTGDFAVEWWAMYGDYVNMYSGRHPSSISAVLPTKMFPQSTNYLIAQFIVCLTAVKATLITWIYFSSVVQPLSLRHSYQERKGSSVSQVTTETMHHFIFSLHLEFGTTTIDSLCTFPSTFLILWSCFTYSRRRDMSVQRWSLWRIGTAVGRRHDRRAFEPSHSLLGRREVPHHVPPGHSWWWWWRELLRQYLQ